MIRTAMANDASQLCEIYNHYVLRTSITFEERIVTDKDMEQRLNKVLETLPWLVWEDGQELQGFCYASKWKERSAYRHSVESTIYLRPDATGRGLGTALYSALMRELKNRNIHTAMGGIALPNIGSIALHEKLGFKKVAHFKQVGKKFGQWIDVGYWQITFEDNPS